MMCACLWESKVSTPAFFFPAFLPSFLPSILSFFLSLFLLSLFLFYFFSCLPLIVCLLLHLFFFPLSVGPCLFLYALLPCLFCLASVFTPPPSDSFFASIFSACNEAVTRCRVEEHLLTQSAHGTKGNGSNGRKKAARHKANRDRSKKKKKKKKIQAYSAAVCGCVMRQFVSEVSWALRCGCRCP